MGCSDPTEGGVGSPPSLFSRGWQPAYRLYMLTAARLMTSSHSSVPDVLTPTPKGYEHGADCDGTVSFPNTNSGGGGGGGAGGAGAVSPQPDAVITFGPGCGYHAADAGPPVTAIARPTARPRGGAGGGAGRGGGTSTPLLNWTHQPMVFAEGSYPCSYAGPPGRIWKAEGPKDQWNMLCGAGGNSTASRGRVGPWARYTTANASLVGPWELADQDFAGGVVGASGAPMFWPLQPQPRRSATMMHGGTSASVPTHILSDGRGGNFAVGTYDPVLEKFAKSGSFNTDYGDITFSAAGQANDGRVLFASWVPQGRDPAADPRCPLVQGIPICGIEMVSAVRVLSWSTAWQWLLANPASEYASLRNGTLLATTTPTAVARATVLPIPAGAGAAMDLVFDVAIPTKPSDALAFQVQVLAPPPALAVEGDDAYEQNANASAPSPALGPPAAAAARITVEILSAFPNGTRVGRIGGKSAASFPILASETSLAVRVLVDRSVAEFFVGGGRSVQTLRAYPGLGDDRVIIAPMASSSGVVLQNVHAYDMGCGWV